VTVKLIQGLHNLQVLVCFTQEVGSLARAGRFDHIVVESTGIGEPLPVAAAFAAVAPDGQMLADVAQLDTMVRALRPANGVTLLTACIDALQYLQINAVGDLQAHAVADMQRRAAVMGVTHPGALSAGHGRGRGGVSTPDPGWAGRPCGAETCAAVSA
jgi:CobW/HypB/UreG, nucleotide-binding domain